MRRGERVIQLTKDLINIDSQNPPGREKAIAGFCRAFLSRAGISSRIVSFRPGRDNIIAETGSGSKRLLITPHLDTVPAGNTKWRFPPLSGRVVGGKLYGLGATDCKCNLACAMEAMVRLAEDNVRLPYRLVFAATADEETGSALGLIPLLEKDILRADAALVLDADDFTVIVAQKGLMHMKLKCVGKRAHGAYPWLGSNAIEKGMSVVRALKKKIAGKGSHRYLRSSTVNVGTIRGGDKVNIVADWCEIELDVRFLPGMSGRDMLAKARKIISQEAGKDAFIETSSIQEPYEIGVGHPLVAGLRQAMSRAGKQARVTGSEGATVITFFQHKGIPAVATGFGTGGCAHMTNEFARAADIAAGADIVEDFLKRFSFGG